MDNLIQDWIAAQYIDTADKKYEAVVWAVDELFIYAQEEPEKLMEVFIRIVSIDCSDKVVKAIGAGPLEDMLVHHGDTLMDELNRVLAANSCLAAAFFYTYLDASDVSSESYSKFLRMKKALPM